MGLGNVLWGWDQCFVTMSFVLWWYVVRLWVVNIRSVSWLEDVATLPDWKIFNVNSYGEAFVSLSPPFSFFFSFPMAQTGFARKTLSQPQKSTNIDSNKLRTSLVLFFSPENTSLLALSAKHSATHFSWQLNSAKPWSFVVWTLQRPRCAGGEVAGVLPCFVGACERSLGVVGCRKAEVWYKGLRCTKTYQGLAKDPQNHWKAVIL